MARVTINGKTFATPPYAATPIQAMGQQVGMDDAFLGGRRDGPGIGGLLIACVDGLGGL